MLCLLHSCHNPQNLVSSRMCRFKSDRRHSFYDHVGARSSGSARRTRVSAIAWKARPPMAPVERKGREEGAGPGLPWRSGRRLSAGTHSFAVEAISLNPHDPA